MGKILLKRKPYNSDKGLDKALCIRAHGEWIGGNCVGAICETCLDHNKDWRGLSRSHIISKGRGGKDTLENIKIECYRCHSKRHGIREI